MPATYLGGRVARRKTYNSDKIYKDHSSLPGSSDPRTFSRPPPLHVMSQGDTRALHGCLWKSVQLKTTHSDALLTVVNVKRSHRPMCFQVAQSDYLHDCDHYWKARSRQYREQGSTRKSALYGVAGSKGEVAPTAT